MTVTLPETWPTYAEKFQIPPWVEDALANIRKAYAEDYAEAIPLPDRQYWTIGTTAHDCEQLVLAVQQMFLGTAENPMELTQCTGPRGLTFTVEVVRCVPTLDNRGKPPSALAGLLRAVTAPVWPAPRPMSFPERASDNVTVWSFEAVAICVPSGLKTTPVTGSRWWMTQGADSPVQVSHTRARLAGK